MLVRCEMCEEHYYGISPMHLKRCSGITVEEYRRRFPGARLTSKETDRLKSEASKASWRGDERHMQRVAAQKAAWTDEMREEMSQTIKQTWASLSTEKRAAWLIKLDENRKDSHKNRTNYPHYDYMSEASSKAVTEKWKDPEYRQIHVEASRKNLGFHWSKEAIRRHSDRIKRTWRESRGPLVFRRPNEEEQYLWTWIQDNLPTSWELNVDGHIKVDGRSPDFVNKGQQQVVELFGSYWHDLLFFPNTMTEEERIAHFAKYGYDCIVLWDYENEAHLLEEKLARFA